jgi:hypothetical protein
MNMTTDTSMSTPSRWGTFTLVFGICFAILYVVCDIAALPLFTYHPGTDRIDLGYAPARRDEGPAMYWYGWLASSTIGAAIIGGIVALLPEKIRGKIPFALAWVVPMLLLPVLIYSLKFYWRW